MEIYFIRNNYSTFTTMYRADTKWVVVTLFWCLFILFLSLYESNKINEFVHFRHQDKLAHLGMYAGLSICLNKLFSQLISPKRKWIFIFCIAFHTSIYDLFILIQEIFLVVFIIYLL